MRERAKSVGETALAALGLDEIVKANTRDNARSSRSRSRHRRHRRRHHDSYPSDDSSDDENPVKRNLNKNSTQAAVLAAAVEAWRARKEPGGLTGERGLKRVIEAAIASGALEAFLGRDGRDQGKSTRHIMEAVLGGLGTQRAINGPRSKSRSRGVTGEIGDLAASGIIAAAGKQLLDMQRSRSSSRPRDGSARRDRPGMHRKRSRSVGDYLAGLGLGAAGGELIHSRHERDRERRHSRRRSRDADDVVIVEPHDDYAVAYAADASNNNNRSLQSTRGNNQVGRAGSGRKGMSSSSEDSDLDLDSDEEKRKHRALHRKEIFGAAIAVMATILAANDAYEAKTKRERRRQELETGEISEAEYAKKKREATLRDLATVGLAVLGAREAYMGWKELMERRKECREFKSKADERRRRRLEKAERERNDGNSGSSSGAEDSRRPSVEYYAQPTYGPPPGAPAGVAGVPPAGTYPYYPATGQIPTQPAPMQPQAYATRDGRTVPVVYPTSVTNA